MFKAFLLVLQLVTGENVADPTMWLTWSECNKIASTIAAVDLGDGIANVVSVVNATCVFTPEA